MKKPAIPILLTLLTSAFIAERASADDDDIVLSALLADIELSSPPLAARRAAAESSELRAKGAGAWSDPFVAIGADEYAFDDVPPMLRFEVSQAIPLPGKLSPRVAIESAEARAAAAGVDVSVRELRLAALQLFLRGVYLERSQASLDEQARVLDETIAATKVRYAAGAGEQRDVLLASAEKAALEQSALVLRRERMMLAARLDALAGHEPKPRLARFVDDRADGKEPLPASLEEALSTQPEVKAIGAALDAAEARADDAGAAAIPDLVVQGMWMQSLHPSHPSTVGAMVGVSVPLFYWWKQGPESDAARRERVGAEADERQLRLALQAEWQEATLRVQSARDNVQLYKERLVPATDAALESARAAYAGQSAQFSELLALLRSKAQVDLGLFAAELDVRLAEARLRNLLSSSAAVELAPSMPYLMPRAMGTSTARSRMSGSSSSSMSERRASPPPGSMMMREMGGM